MQYESIRLIFGWSTPRLDDRARSSRHTNSRQEPRPHYGFRSSNHAAALKVVGSRQCSSSPSILLVLPLVSRLSGRFLRPEGGNFAAK